jgi:hypothetical protein
MPFEDEFAQAVRQVGDTFQSDNRTLIEAGVARGRRLRRRRTAGLVGGAAAVAMIGVGGAFAGGVLGSGGAATTLELPVSSAGTARPAPSGTSATFTDKQMIGLLRALLPVGRISQESGRGIGGREEPKDAPSAQVVFDDGKGAAEVAVSVARVGPRNANSASVCLDKVHNPYNRCTWVKLRDGGVLLVDQGYEYPDRGPVDTKNWTVTLTAKDGGQVTVSEWNAPAEKGAAVTRAEPPLNVDQLSAIATSTVWKSVWASLPAVAMKAAPTERGPSQGAVTESLGSLLPKGLKSAGWGVRSSYGYMTVDDGRGRILAEVAIQEPSNAHWAQQFVGARRLPKGARLTITREPSEKGGKSTVR